MTGSTPDVHKSTLQFFDSFLETNNDGEGSQYVPAITNELFTIRPDEPPWVFGPSLGDRINSSSNSEVPQKTGTPTKSSQPIVFQTPKLKALRPWKSSLKSRDFTYPNTIKPKPSQHSVGEESELNSQQKFGRRRGPLPPKYIEHATKMRNIRACWSCRLRKVTVI